MKHIETAMTVWLFWFAAGCVLAHPGQLDGGMRDVIGVDADVTRVDAGDVSDARDAADAPDAPCPSGQIRCSGNCVSVDVPERCGSCTNDCRTRSNVSAASVGCAAGVCAVTGACLPDFADCDGNEMNGCEASRAMSPNCGMCGVTCAAPTPRCSRARSDAGPAPFVCTDDCVAPDVLCATRCINPATDVANCGTCGNSCAPRAGAMTRCMAGSCVFTCNPGYHDCGTRCALDTSIADCGPGCLACPAVANGTPVCATGACDVTCSMGFMRAGPNSCVPEPECGNGMLAPGEECDDGNTSPNDGCSPTCLMESGVLADACGGTTRDILIRGAGRFIYTGSTSAFTNNGSGSCTGAGSGRDAVVHVRFAITGSFSLTVELLAPGFNGVLHFGPDPCPGACFNAGGDGVAERFVGTLNGPIARSIAADGATGSDHGNFVIRIIVTVP